MAATVGEPADPVIIHRSKIRGAELEEGKASFPDEVLALLEP